MIRVERGPGPRVLDLSDKTSPASKELKKATDFYSKPQTGKNKKKKKKSFKFAVYSHEDVKAALIALFRNKCAYCESRYAGTQPMDVEHWRPKARVRGEDGKEEAGYYWLASEWTNLLPSCIDCNRERGQMLADIGKTQNAGKADRFPIEPGTKRATKKEELGLERPLLLHPCEDHPEEHFTFNEDAVIRPRKSVKAEKSIEVYALNRLGLVEERQQVLRLIQQRMTTIDRLSRLLENERIPARVRNLIEDLITHEMVELSRFRWADRPFSLMARQIIDGYFAKLRDEVARS